MTADDSVRVGLLLPTRDRLLDGQPAIEPLLHLAADAEVAGLDSVWVGDSPVVRPRHDALTLLAGVAARTERVHLGTAVLVAPLRHPLLVLHQAATVDLLARGRLILGMGSGFPLEQTRLQFDAVQASYDERVGRLEDTVNLARAVWSNAPPTTFRGRTLAVERAELQPPPHRTGGPPVWLAGGGPAGLRRVAALADGWMPYPPTPERYAEDLEVVIGHARALGRRTPTAGLYATVAIDDDTRRAEGRAREHVERYYGIPLELVQAVQAVLIGTPDEARDQLLAYRRAGAEHIVVRAAGPIDTDELVPWLVEVRRSLRQLSPTTATATSPTTKLREVVG